VTDWLSRDQWRVVFAVSAAIILFAAGEVLRPGFASLGGIESVLVVASFVGFVAAGQMFVILVGGIDLSVPWVLNAAAIELVTSTQGADSRLALGMMATLGIGLLVGLVNGIGVALFGVPAVVMTLAMNGIVEGLTLGLSSGMTCEACAAYAPPIVQRAVHERLLGAPAELYVWLVVIGLVSFVLKATVFGRATYAVGNSARVSYLAGIRVGAVTVTLYALSGLFAALAGIMLAGFGGQASLGMGDPYLFQSIAAVVIGGVYILGGRGGYIGTAAGAVTLVALVSVLLAMNMPDYGRSIVYGVIILGLMLVYGREEDS
jgi:ribose transport system permease protein